MLFPYIGSQSSSDCQRGSSFPRSRSGIINQNRDPDQQNNKKKLLISSPNKNSSNQHSLVSRRTGKPLEVTLPKDLISYSTSTEQKLKNPQSPSKFTRPRNNQPQSSISLSVRSLPRSSSSISSSTHDKLDQSSNSKNIPHDTVSQNHQKMAHYRQ